MIHISRNHSSPRKPSLKPLTALDRYRSVKEMTDDLLRTHETLYHQKKHLWERPRSPQKSLFKGKQNSEGKYTRNFKIKRKYKALEPNQFIFEPPKMSVKALQTISNQNQSPSNSSAKSPTPISIITVQDMRPKLSV